jgi:hypothetical protein
VTILRSIPATPNGPARSRVGPFPFSGAALALALALAPAAAGAGAGPWVVRAEAGAGLLRFDYAERYATGAVIDRERGWLPAASLSLGGEAGRWFVLAAGRVAAGEVGYDGRTQSSNPAYDDLPVTSRSGARLLAADLRGGGWIDGSRRVALTGGVARRRWDRDIHSTTVTPPGGAPIAVSGLHEIYDWWELEAGLKVGLLRADRLDVELEGAWVVSVAPSIAVDWGGSTVDLALASRHGARAAVAARWTLRAGTWLTGGLDGEWRRFGASAIDPAAGIYEPDSATFAWGLRIGVAQAY